MAIVSPLIQSQPPEIKNTARFCNSSMVATRPIGFIARVRAPASSPGLMRLLMPSVGISPGAMVLRRIPYLPHSTASDMVMAWIADLLIADGVVDEVGQGTFGPDRFDHLVDGHGVADIDAVAHHASAVQIHQFGRGL